MSHSQFHSTNLFILRHAWLNLWDKHMTTGRINQVTTFRIALLPEETSDRSVQATSRSLSRAREFINRLCFLVLDRDRRTGLQLRSLLALSDVDEIVPPWHRVSHVSDTTSPCYRVTEIVLLVEDYQRPESSRKTHTQSRRISEWLFEDRFSYQQVIHTLRTSQTSNEEFDTDRAFRSASISPKLVNVLVIRCVNNSVWEKPAFPWVKCTWQTEWVRFQLL